MTGCDEDLKVGIVCFSKEYSIYLIPAITIILVALLLILFRAILRGSFKSGSGKGPFHAKVRDKTPTPKKTAADEEEPARSPSPLSKRGKSPAPMRAPSPAATRGRKTPAKRRSAIDIDNILSPPGGRRLASRSTRGKRAGGHD